MLEMCGWLLTSKVESWSSWRGRDQSGRKRHSDGNSLSSSNRTHERAESFRTAKEGRSLSRWPPCSAGKGRCPFPAPHPRALRERPALFSCAISLLYWTMKDGGRDPDDSWKTSR